MAFLCLFDSIIREVNNINIALKHLLLEIISKIFDEKKTLFDYFNRF